MVIVRFFWAVQGATLFMFLEWFWASAQYDFGPELISFRIQMTSLAILSALLETGRVDTRRGVAEQQLSLGGHDQSIKHQVCSMHSILRFIYSMYCM